MKLSSSCWRLRACALGVARTTLILGLNSMAMTGVLMFVEAECRIGK